MTRNRETALLLGLFVALYIGAAFGLWALHHPRCNQVQAWRHLGDVLTLSTTEECR